MNICNLEIFDPYQSVGSILLLSLYLLFELSAPLPQFVQALFIWFLSLYLSRPLSFSLSLSLFLSLYLSNYPSPNPIAHSLYQFDSCYLQKP